MTIEPSTPDPADVASDRKVPGSLKLDVASGYALAFSRVAAWAIVSGFIIRQMNPMAFGIFALLRSSVTLLSYTSLGIAPAMVHALAHAARAMPAIPVGPEDFKPPEKQGESQVLPYANLAPAVDVRAGTLTAVSPQQVVFASGWQLAMYALLVAVPVLLFLSEFLDGVVTVPSGFDHGSIPATAFLLGVGVIFRIIGEPLSAVLQTKGKLYVDQFVLAGGELAWAAAVLLTRPGSLGMIAAQWVVLNLVILVCRQLFATQHAPELIEYRGVKKSQMRSLLKFGLAITLAQVADFLYAPIDFVLIGWLLHPQNLVAYAPAVQIDAGLLLVVAGISVALFPRAAALSAMQDRRRLRRLYAVGTLTSAILLAGAAAIVLITGDWLLTKWLSFVPPGTLEILPLVLMHTVIGGSSGVGRSIILGMGHARAFTISVLIAGIANVILSATLAGPMGFGLKGIVLATIIVVTARCAIWMPWYVWRATREVRVNI